MTDGGPSWGYCLEAATVPETREIFVLMRSDETATMARTLQWVSLSTLQTRKQVEHSSDVTYSGPSEEVMQAILRLFRDAFEFAVDTNWSYTKRLEFFHSFPFEELCTVDAVHKFRPVLFGCPAFTDSIDVDLTPPKDE
jgi:long-subunit fatty acid transport protein